MNNEGHDGTEDAIELGKAVQAIRDGLMAAAERAEGQDLAFELGDIEMDFTVELRKELKGGGKVKAWVLEAGADATRASTRTHRVSFTLRPKDNRTGEPWKVGNGSEGSVAGFGPR
ncbi:trypco2 family protein [Streptomyces sp. DT20]|uniref:trypco2 family protein n=1 Tax=Streptomyces sp. DT20 TaxID=3416519 RepID=UPI003CFAF744